MKPLSLRGACRLYLIKDVDSVRTPDDLGGEGEHPFRHSLERGNRSDERGKNRGRLFRQQHFIPARAGIVRFVVRDLLFSRRKAVGGQPLSRLSRRGHDRGILFKRRKDRCERQYARGARVRYRNNGEDRRKSAVRTYLFARARRLERGILRLYGRLSPQFRERTAQKSAAYVRLGYHAPPAFGRYLARGGDFVPQRYRDRKLLFRHTARGYTAGDALVPVFPPLSARTVRQGDAQTFGKVRRQRDRLCRKGEFLRFDGAHRRCGRKTSGGCAITASRICTRRAFR